MKNDADFLKILDGDRIIGVLNFNEMIPVNETVIQRIDIRPSPNDDEQTRRRKRVLAKQLTFCQKNQDAIVRKANRLYRIVYLKGTSIQLVRRCCDFKRLEKVLKKRMEKQK